MSFSILYVVFWFWLSSRQHCYFVVVPANEVNSFAFQLMIITQLCS